jgi:hypothetical protein
LRFNKSPSVFSTPFERSKEYLSPSFRDVVKGKGKAVAPTPEACHALPPKGGFMVDACRPAQLLPCPLQIWCQLIRVVALHLEVFQGVIFISLGKTTAKSV